MLVRTRSPNFFRKLNLLDSPLPPLSLPPSQHHLCALSSIHLSRRRCYCAQAQETSSPNPSPTDKERERFVRRALFVPPGVSMEEVTEDMILPGSNIVAGPYAGHSQVKQMEFVKSSGRAKDSPKDDLPEFAFLGRSNVGKSSLINTLIRKKDFALTSKKPEPCCC